MARRLIRMCFDRVVEPDLIVEAANAAAGENPANLPAPAMDFSSGPSGPFEIALETRTLWRPGRALRVTFMDGVPSVQAKVAQVAQEWQQYANIRFEFGDDAEAEIRISFIADRGSWSYLGTDALTIPMDKPTMNFGWLRVNTPFDEYQRVVLHEFGHALGCIHEHQHPQVGIPWNTAAVYRKYSGPPNFWAKEKVDRNLFQKYNVDQTQFSAFDRESIMLYPVPRDLTDGVFEVGWNMKLSALDKEFVGRVYPFETKTAVELSLGAEPTEASIGVHGEEDLYRFTAQEPGCYTIETRGRTDVSMSLYGPDEATRLVAHDDDSGTGRNARITAELAPGTYTVTVRHYRPRGTGKYTIAARAGE